MQLALLLTGDELMTGDIVDSNSAMIAKSIEAYGWRIHCKSTVGDDLSLLVSEIKRLSQHHDVLIINGGLGPTVDDLTAEALAKACNVPLQEHPESVAHLKTWCQRLNIPLSTANLKQAMLPKNCNIISSPIGSAVGFSVTLNDCLILCTPGVPKELLAMLNESILPLIAHHFSTESMHTLRLVSFGLGESTLQEMIHSNFPDWPAEIRLGFRASYPTVEIKLTIAHANDLKIREEWKYKLITLLGEFYIGDNESCLAQATIEACKTHQKTIVTAESCSGGMISSQLTQIPGSSEVFLGGLVTYSNEMKTQILNVPATVIEQNGAVSEEVAIAMAKGALEKSHADIVIAVTGIAGPGGGSDEKPVGSVWVCWGEENQLHTSYLLINGNRQQFQQWLSAMALDLIRRTACNLSPHPHYLLRRIHPNQ